MPMVAVVVISVSISIPIPIPVAIPVAPPIIAISVPAMVSIPVPIVFPPAIVTLIPAFTTVILIIESVEAVSVLIHPNLFKTPTVVAIVLVIITVVVDNYEPGIPVFPGPPATVVTNVDPAGIASFVDDPPRPGIPVPVADVNGSNHRAVADPNVRAHPLSSC